LKRKAQNRLAPLCWCPAYGKDMGPRMEMACLSRRSRLRWGLLVVNR